MKICFYNTRLKIQKFRNQTTKEDENVEMSILEVEAGVTKCRFYVEGIEIRPEMI